MSNNRLFLFKSSLIIFKVSTGSKTLTTASFEMNGLASGFLCRMSESVARG